MPSSAAAFRLLGALTEMNFLVLRIKATLRIVRYSSPWILTLIFILASLVTSPVALPNQDLEFSDLAPHEQLAEDILRQLIAFESTIERPDETRKALEAMASLLVDAGLPAEDVLLINPYPDGYGLVARYRGIATQGPLLTMAHIDVVTAEPDAWAFPPFSFGKKDGFYYGRGTQDNKTGVAHLVANFIRLKREGHVPNRDLIMALTGDEETQQKVIEWLATEGKDLIEADYAINSDAGGGELGDDGKPRAFWVQTSEKLYQTYRLSTTNPGGHSSLPRPQNAINQLAIALTRIADYQFPVELNEGSRQMLERAASFADKRVAQDMLKVAQSQDSDAAERLSQDPLMNAVIRTTCVVTKIEGGHAENALPRSASALVNCRILPGIPPLAIETRLRELVDDDGVAFESVYESVPSLPSVMPAALMETIESLVNDRWQGVKVIPEMSTGATDGLFIRNAGIPVYGVAGWFMHPDDIRAHGLDEKVGIRQFHEGAEFWYRLLKKLSQ